MKGWIGTLVAAGSLVFMVCATVLTQYWTIREEAVMSTEATLGAECRA